MGRLKTYQEQVQESVEKALKVVEDQHRAIAAKPFDYAEKVEAEAKDLSVKSIRKAHDKALDSMYSAFHSWNKKVNEFTSDLVAKLDKEEVEEEEKKAPAKRKSTAKKAASKAVADKTEEEVA